jgi:hypothetical protein
MSYNVLVKILNFRENKISLSIDERKELIGAYRKDLKDALINSVDVLEGVIDKINND